MNIKNHHNLFLALMFLLLVALYPHSAVAAPVSESNVELEWEEIPGAQKYDLEVKSTKKTFDFSVKQPQWNGRLSPGFFKMRVRARDQRNVPGEWSEYQEFKVFLDSPNFVNPVSGSVIASNKDIQAVTFKWDKVYASKKYILDVTGIDSEFRKKSELTDLDTTIDLPTAVKFRATLSAANDVLTSSPEKDKTIEFILSGEKVGNVKITAPDSVYLRELKWTKSTFAQGYHYILEKQDAKTQKYTLIEENKEYPSEILPFKKEWSGGIYRLSVKAIANYRPASEFVSIRFNVRDGDRSEKAEQLARLRESIERLSGWFVMTSYLVNSVKYDTLNYDLTGTQNPFDAIGGTLRLGIGYVTKRNPWGYFVAAEMSTLKVNGFGQLNYKTLELNSIYKVRPNDSGEFRQTTGLLYKELPEITQSFNGHFKNSVNVAALGFRYGVEYWQALTPKIGVQANAHLFPLFSKVKTTNSQPLAPSVSYQAGFLASYRFSKNLTTLLGYAYRVDHMEYKTAPSKNFPFPANDKNKINLEGHYLNLLLEYQL